MSPEELILKVIRNDPAELRVLVLDLAEENERLKKELEVAKNALEKIICLARIVTDPETKLAGKALAEIEALEEGKK